MQARYTPDISCHWSSDVYVFSNSPVTVSHIVIVVQSCLGELSEVNAYACTVVAVLVEADGGGFGHFKT